MADNNGTNQGNSTGIGGLLIVAALILGASVVGASMIVRDSLDEGTAELSQMRTAMAQLESAVRSGGGQAAAAPREVARPDRPDPNKRYEIDTTGSPAMGPASAKVEIVEFSDFQCPFCARVTPTLKKVEEEYGEDVRIVFKHLPLSIHPKAPAAHAASEAAHLQGKFWEMHDKIFGNQREMSEEKYVEYAAELGLDVEKFKRDSSDSKVKQKIDKDMKDAAKVLVRGTPGFFINGRFLSGAQPFSAFKRLIDEELGQG